MTKLKSAARAGDERNAFNFGIRRPRTIARPVPLINRRPTKVASIPAGTNILRGRHSVLEAFSKHLLSYFVDVELRARTLFSSPSGGDDRIIVGGPQVEASWLDDELVVGLAFVLSDDASSAVGVKSFELLNFFFIELDVHSGDAVVR